MAYTDIDKPDLYFNTKLTTGTGSTQAVTGLGFQPDFLWGKRRDSTGNNTVFDVVRGITKGLETNSTGAEFTSTDYYDSFDSDGFTISSGAGGCGNGSGQTAVQWCWLASNTTASNTDGSITSTVSANTTSGFSIVSWIGDGTSTATIGHSLGVVPSMIILKNRTDVTNWVVKHKSLSSGYNLFLNDTSAVYNTTGQGHLADLSSSSTFGFVAGSSGNNQSNGSGDNMIAYCFAEKKGFSKFGSYTGNGSTDGTFVYTGFKPAFVIVKQTDTTNIWGILDNKRDPFNDSTESLLRANASDAENTTYKEIEFVSNGMKVRSSGTGTNASGGNYIYMCFAENPFVTSGGIPTTAR